MQELFLNFWNFLDLLNVLEVFEAHFLIKSFIIKKRVVKLIEQLKTKFENWIIENLITWMESEIW